MPTAPTFLSVTAFPGYIELHYYDVGVGDHNQIWRQTPSEYGGVFIKIADSLPWVTNQLDPADEPHFRDYNTGSGKVYTYYLVAVDSGGVTSPTGTMSGSLTLSTGWLHAVNKIATGNILGANAAESGANFMVVSMLDLIPHNRQYSLGSTTYLLGNADTPTIGAGNIEGIGVGLTNRIPNTIDTQRQSIRDIYDARRYCCLRDTRGNKFFGQLTYSEQYQSTFTDLSIAFQVTDFSEAI